MRSYYYPDYMYHYGVKGMKWGAKRASDSPLLTTRQMSPTKTTNMSSSARASLQEELLKRKGLSTTRQLTPTKTSNMPASAQALVEEELLKRKDLSRTRQVTKTKKLSDLGKQYVEQAKRKTFSMKLKNFSKKSINYGKSVINKLFNRK